MKKFSFIMALFAILALMFTGCPEEAEEDDDVFAELPATLEAAFPNTDTEGTEKTTIVLSGNNLTVTPGTGTPIEMNADLMNSAGVDLRASIGLSFEYKTNIDCTLGFSDVGNMSSMFIAGWGSLVAVEDWTFVEIYFADITTAWGTGNLDRSKIAKLWIGTGDTEPEADSKFELKDFAFITQ